MKGIAVLIAVICLYTVATTRASNQCSWAAGSAGALCSDNRCCSRNNYCGTSVDFCSPTQGCKSNCWSGEKAYVKATWANYDAMKYGWDMKQIGVNCAKVDGGKPLWWRLKFPWAAFCGSVGPQGQTACGQCLRVWNSQRRFPQTVRIVDYSCNTGGLVLDHELFKLLDKDGKGEKEGHMKIGYDFVECNDNFDDKIDYFHSIV